MLSSQPFFSIPDISKMIPPVPDISKMIPPIPDISKMVDPIPEISKMIDSMRDISKMIPPIPDISKMVGPIPEISKMVESVQAQTETQEVLHECYALVVVKSVTPDEQEILNHFEKELLKLAKNPIERIIGASRNTLFTALKTAFEQATYNSFVKHAMTRACSWVRRVMIAIVSARHSNSVDEFTFDLLIVKVRSFATFVSKVLRSCRYSPRQSASCLSKISIHLRNYWPPDKLTKPIAFVVNNADCKHRCSLLSTPLVPSLCMGSKNLL